MVRRYKGETVAPGVALGHVHLQGYEAEEEFPLRIASDQVDGELDGLRTAIELSREQIEELKRKHGDSLGESELAIFDVHIAYLGDPMFVGEIEKLVVHERLSVRAAIKKIAADYDRIFELVEADYLRQRAGDFRDVATRVLRNLAARGDRPREAAGRMPTGRYVLVARRLTVNDLFKIDNEQVEGIVTEEGGIHSHAAILARSMGIPALTGIPDLPSKVSEGAFVVVDAGSGEFHVDPDARLRAEFEETADRLRRAPMAPPPSELQHETRDGVAVRLLAACGSLAEVGMARDFGMDGLGLYRTELMFLVEPRLPTEDILVHHYSEVIDAGGGSAFLRLLDVPSSASVPTLPAVRERNPSIGLRGVRALLHDGRVLRLQVRAILRAAAGVETAAVLVPFVTSINDLQRVKAAILEERHELRKKKIKCADRLLVAPIVEVPAAAFTCGALLNESDFLVVALDDLQALLLASDRDSAAVRAYYGMPHPAMFELLQRIARAAIQAEKPLVLFGESAADPQRVPFYLGIGIRDFAIAPINLGPMLEVLRLFTIDECERIAEELLEAPRALDVQRVLLRASAPAARR